MHSEEEYEKGKQILERKTDAAKGAAIVLGGAF